jgi:hypothetical protein
MMSLDSKKDLGLSMPLPHSQVSWAILIKDGESCIPLSPSPANGFAKSVAPTSSPPRPGSDSIDASIG